MSVYHKLEDGARNIYKHITTGGFWNQCQLEQIDESNGTCQHCGQKITSSGHVLWNCPHINECRQHKDLCSITHETLPKAIRNGIAVGMDKNTKGSFWGNKYDPNDDIHINNDTKILLGQEDDDYDNIIDDICRKRGINHDVNARQLFQNIKNVTNVDKLPLPYIQGIRQST